MFGEGEWADPKEDQNAAHFTLKLGLNGEAKGIATLELTRENGAWKVDRLSVP